MEIVFNRERREMTVIRTTPLRRSREVIPMQAVASIGLDGTQDPESRAYSYRAVIRLDNGRNIHLFGWTPIYSRYDRILAKVREFTGITKQDNLYRFEDSWSRPAN